MSVEARKEAALDRLVLQYLEKKRQDLMPSPATLVAAGSDHEAIPQCTHNAARRYFLRKGAKAACPTGRYLQAGRYLRVESRALQQNPMSLAQQPDPKKGIVEDLLYYLTAEDNPSRYALSFDAWPPGWTTPWTSTRSALVTH